MADDAQDVTPADITPEDFDGEQDTTKAAPSVAEDKKPDAVKPEAPVQAGDTAAEPKAPEELAAPEGEPAKPAETPSKADERKSQLNTEIRDLVAQRNALRDEVTKRNSEVYQPATEDELVQEGMSATDAKVEALRQEIEVGKYNDRVAEAQLTIESESQHVLTDFPIFNPDSDQYDQELANEAAALLQANLIFDPNTQQVIGSNVSPYQLYKTLAKASGISTVKGQIKGQQAAAQMSARADNASPMAPAKKAVDPVAELWKDEL